MYLDERKTKTKTKINDDQMTKIFSLLFCFFFLLFSYRCVRKWILKVRNTPENNNPMPLEMLIEMKTDNEICENCTVWFVRSRGGPWPEKREQQIDMMFLPNFISSREKEKKQMKHWPCHIIGFNGKRTGGSVLDSTCLPRKIFTTVILQSSSSS